VIPDSPRRPFVATSQMRGDGVNIRPLETPGISFLKSG
jgi:hypothetical protein